MTGVLTRRVGGTRNACTQRTGHVKAQREGDHLQAKERGLRRNQTCQHLDLRLPASRTERKFISVV